MNNPLSTKVFFSVIGIIMIVIGWLFSSVRANEMKVDGLENSIIDTRISIGEIKKDISWIREALASLQTITYKENGTIN